MSELEKIRRILSNISCAPFGQVLQLHAHHDKAKTPIDGEPRVYLQVVYDAPDSKTGQPCTWKGRKWYLSEHMTHDEVVKTAYAAVELALRHELMESFQWQGKRLFNPHARIEKLLIANQHEDKRT